MTQVLKGLVKPAPWRIRPRATAAPELWRGMVLAHYNAQTLRNEVSGASPTSVGSRPVPATTLLGVGLESNVTDLVYDGLPNDAGDAVTYAVVMVHNSGGEFGRIVDQYPDNDFVQIRDDETVQWQDGVNNFSSNVIAPVGTPFLVMGRVGGGNPKTIDLWNLTTREHQSDSTTSSGPGARTGIEIANSEGGAAVDGTFLAWYAWDRYLSDAEIAILSTDPFAPFRPARRRRVFVAAAAPATGRTTTFLTTLGVA